MVFAQKRLVRTISFAPRDHRSIPLFIQNRLLSFKYIFQYFSCVVAFKFLNLGYCFDIFSASQNQRELRNNINILTVPFFRTTRGQKSVFYLTPSIWNSLPSDLRQINNINSFKHQLKSYLINQQLDLLRNIV